MDTYLSLDLGSRNIGYYLEDVDGNRISADTIVLPDGRQGEKRVTNCSVRRKYRLNRRITHRRVERMSKVDAFFISIGFINKEDTLFHEDSKLHNLNEVLKLRHKGLSEELTPGEFYRIFRYFAHHRGYMEGDDYETTSDEELKEYAKKLKNTEGMQSYIQEGGTVVEYVYEKLLDKNWNNLRPGGKRFTKEFHILNSWMVSEFTKIWNRQTTFERYSFLAGDISEHHRRMFTEEKFPFVHHDVEKVELVDTKKYVKVLNKFGRVKTINGGYKTVLFDYVINYRRHKSGRGSKSKCSICPHLHTTPIYKEFSQRFRTYQGIQSFVKEVTSDGELIPVSGESLIQLYNVLLKDNKKKMTTRSINTILKKHFLDRFLLGNYDGIEILFDHTRYSVGSVVGFDVYDKLSQTEMDILLNEIFKKDKFEKFEKFIKNRYPQFIDFATSLHRLKLEEGYAAFSQKALGRVINELHSDTGLTIAGIIYNEELRSVLDEKWNSLTEEQHKLFKAYSGHTYDHSNQRNKILPTKYRSDFERWSNDTRPALTDNHFIEKMNHPISKKTVYALRGLLNSLDKKHNIRVRRIRVEAPLERKVNKTEHSLLVELNRRKREYVFDKYNANDNPHNQKIKLLLWLEQGGVNLFNGKNITMEELYGLDKEHIVPRNYIGDIMENLTLSESYFNKELKKERTPREMVDDGIITEQEFEQMINRVKSVERYRDWEKYHNWTINQKKVLSKLVKRENENYTEAKIKHFLSRKNDIDNVASSDTEYTSLVKDVQRFIQKWDSSIKMEIVDPVAVAFTRHVNGIDDELIDMSNQTKDMLRELYGFDLDENTDTKGKKTRSDNRNHAVDAFVVSKLSPSLTKKAKNKVRRGIEGLFDKDEVRSHIENVTCVRKQKKLFNGMISKDGIASPKKGKGLKSDKVNRGYKVREGKVVVSTGKSDSGNLLATTVKNYKGKHRLGVILSPHNILNECKKDYKKVRNSDFTLSQDEIDLLRVDDMFLMLPLSECNGVTLSPGDKLPVSQYNKYCFYVRKIVKGKVYFHHHTDNSKNNHKDIGKTGFISSLSNSCADMIKIKVKKTPTGDFVIKKNYDMLLKK